MNYIISFCLIEKGKANIFKKIVFKEKNNGEGYSNL
jgi:hypothetical protein